MIGGKDQNKYCYMHITYKVYMTDKWGLNGHYYKNLTLRFKDLELRSF